jgi:hypothetical protein
MTAGGLLALLGTVPGTAQAQAKLEGAYTISVARIPIGSVTTSAEFGDGKYVMSMSGRAGGALRILAGGEGTLTARGALRDGRPQPTNFVARTTTDDDTLDVKLTFNDGNVTGPQSQSPIRRGSRSPRPIGGACSIR